MTLKTTSALLIGLLTFGLAGSLSFAQPAATNNYVTREEYEKLLKEVQGLQTQLKAAEEKRAEPSAETEQVLDEMEKKLKEVKSLASAVQPGLTKPLITGYAFAGYTDAHDEVSSINAGFNPIFLWKQGERLFFEGELEVEFEEGEVEVALEYAHASYVLNDYITLGAGKFLAPNNYFMERLHPAWINKLPDKPILMDGDTRLQAHTQLGLQVRGAAPLGPAKVGYALYVSPGPSIRTSGASAGTLRFNNFEVNNNKAFGGRVGFFPIPQLEIGYGFEVAEVGNAGSAFAEVGAVSHALDLNYVRDSRLLHGTVDLRSQIVWLSIDNPNVAPLNFQNDRVGGYVQLAYRPSQIDVPILKNLEAVARFDWLDLPAGAPNNEYTERWTVGLDYWLGASTVLKAAYEFGNREELDAFLLQVAMGF